MSTPARPIPGTITPATVQPYVPPAQPQTQVVEIPSVPDNSGLRKSFVDLIGTTTAAYNNLIQAQHDNDAFALRSAMQKFARTGSSTGVSRWARIQAATDLRATMAASARVLQGTTTAAALNAQAGLLGKIGDLDAQTFQQTLNRAQQELQIRQQQANEYQFNRGATLNENQFTSNEQQRAFNNAQQQWENEQGLKQVEKTDLNNQWNKVNEYNQQQTGIRNAFLAAHPQPVSTSSAEADARMKAMGLKLTTGVGPTTAPVMAATTTGSGVQLQPGQKWGWSSGLPATKQPATTPFPEYKNYFGGTAWGA